MTPDWRIGLRLASTALACVVVGVSAYVAGPAHADDANPSLPVFVPHPSDWTPNLTLSPYDSYWQRGLVTPEMITAELEACQWFNAQYEPLRSQIYGFENYLGGRHDDWSGVQGVANTVRANINQSAAFLDPRAHTLFINDFAYDKKDYSPLYNGDSIYYLWYQLTQISDKMNQKRPSGQIHAHIATMNVYGTVIHDSGVCDGA
jgi:hypothetical protein